MLGQRPGEIEGIAAGLSLVQSPDEIILPLPGDKEAFIHFINWVRANTAIK